MKRHEGKKEERCFTRLATLLVEMQKIVNSYAQGLTFKENGDRQKRISQVSGCFTAEWKKWERCKVQNIEMARNNTRNLQ